MGPDFANQRMRPARPISPAELMQVIARAQADVFTLGADLDDTLGRFILVCNGDDPISEFLAQDLEVDI
jgi:hypothetical protein